MKKTWTVFVFFLYTIVMYGQQEGSGPLSMQYEAQMPKVLFPSPQAMSFMRYGQIPVSLSSGVPEISIPLYTLKANGIEIPISLSYHASGIKVKDVPGTTGLGWVLNAGGMIAQTVYSWDDHDDVARHNLMNTDFFRSAYLATQKLWEEYEANKRNDALGNAIGHINLMWYACMVGFDSFMGQIPFYPDTYNTISDRYYYNCNGTTGVFRFNLQAQQYESIPHSPYKIQAIANNGGFVIVDDQGIRWTFSFFTETENVNLYSHPATAKEYYLTSIRFPGISEEVTFTYTTGQPYDMVYRTESVFSGRRPHFTFSTGEIPSVLSYTLLPTVDERSISQQRMRSTPALIQSITWKDTEIHFSYETKNDAVIKKKLEQIVVKVSGQEIKRIKMFQDKTFLSKIQINDELYTFNYNSYFGSNLNEDFWGYYNGKITPHIVPFKWVWDNVSASSKRTYIDIKEVNPSASQSCMLNRITYPTGGHTDFKYESNYGRGVYRNLKQAPVHIPIEIIDPGNGGIIFDPYLPILPYSLPASGNSNTEDMDYFGGVRIKKISNFDSNGQEIGWKSYEYEGGPTVTLTPEHFCATKLFYYLPSSGHLLINHAPIIEPGETGAMGTDYPFTEHGAHPVFYHKVSEYTGRGTEKAGKTEYFFERDSAYTENAFYLSNYDKGIVAPLLTSKKEYAFQNGHYELKKETRNYYEKVDKGHFITGVDVKHDYVYTPNLKNFTSISGTRGFFENYYPHFTFYDINAFRDIVQLSRTVTTEYNNGVFTTDVEYGYDSQHRILSPTTIKEKSSLAGIHYMEKVFHPFNKTSAPYTEMVHKNIVAPVVQKTRVRSPEAMPFSHDVPLLTLENNYRKEGNLFVIDNVSTGTGENTPEKRIQYHQYDQNGNPVYITKDSNTKIVYLWGYRGQYPIAEIQNASYEEVKAALLPLTPEALSEANAPNMNAVEGLRQSASLLKAHITTLTYYPGIGVSSQKDPNGITVYYEYDNNGHLKTIKDHEGNIVQQYEYQYGNP